MIRHGSVRNGDYREIFMATETLLNFRGAAENFNQAIPIGNGRIGGMVYGGAEDELIKLNEDSVWSGGMRNRINPNSLEGYNEVKALLKEGKLAEAEKTAFEKMQGVTPNSRRYMPLGNLYIHTETGGRTRELNRCLDLFDATTETSFLCEDTEFKRVAFVSAVDQVMVIHITASKPGALDLSCWIDGREDYYDDNRPLYRKMIMFDGGTGGKDGINFAVCLGAMTDDDGELTTLGGKLRITNATEATLLLSVRTSFYSGEPKEEAEIDILKALNKTYKELYTVHAASYREYFDRVELNLNDNSGEDLSDLTTDERIARLKGDVLDTKECARLIHDNKLIELFFNYGRYLMISASRPGTQPMNLQGIWNEDMNPIWGSRYVTNVNLEMNYWCAEVCALPECHTPLFTLLKRIADKGSFAAREMYGIERGFVCHHNTDIWGDPAPQDEFVPATLWPTGGAWLALHIFEHYEYTLDENFLRGYYPILKGAAEFMADFLTDDGTGHLVTCPSVSPENSYINENGEKGSLCMGPSMDSQIITVLFRDVIKAASILGCDEEFSAELSEKLEKLYQPKPGRYGQIQEWAKDYTEPDIGHSHISQLFALHPADLITPASTPRLADAARATLVRRLIHGEGHRGWSSAWITNMWARLYDGRMVYENLKKLLSHSINPNLTASYPPFQIDGNLGGTAAIAEALVQSTNGEIVLLPAVPDEWRSGHVRGLRAKGGFSIEMDWYEGQVITAVITSDHGGECRLRMNCDADIIRGIRGIHGGVTIPVIKKDGVIIFRTEPDEIYSVSPIRD